MQASDIPVKIVLPFAGAGGRNVIPVPTQTGITPGKASYADGFPPLTRQPLSSGGIPPFGLDMNGVLYDATAWSRWAAVGGACKFDNTFATNANVNGYPLGAVVQAADNTGWWRSTVDNNVNNPDTGGAGWVPHFFTGLATQALAASNVTLTAVQYAKQIIVLSGTLTANVQVILPNLVGEWLFINNTTGAFTITVKTSAGTGPVLVANANLLYGDGTNVVAAFRNNTASLTSNGYEISSSGLITQWGVVAIPSGSNVGSASFTFPIPFTTALWHLSGNANDTASGSWAALVAMFPQASRTLSGAQVTADTADAANPIAAGRSVNWLAIGR